MWVAALPLLPVMQPPAFTALLHASARLHYSPHTSYLKVGSGWEGWGVCACVCALRTHVVCVWVCEYMGVRVRTCAP